MLTPAETNILRNRHFVPLYTEIWRCCGHERCRYHGFGQQLMAKWRTRCFLGRRGGPKKFLGFRYRLQWNSKPREATTNSPKYTKSPALTQPADNNSLHQDHSMDKTSISDTPHTTASYSPSTRTLYAQYNPQDTQKSVLTQSEQRNSKPWW